MKQSLNNDQKIYNLVIDKIVTAMPPPPPPPGQHKEISQKTLDSIYKLPVKVAVHPYKIKCSLKDATSEIQAESEVIYSGSDDPVNMQQLTARANVTLELLKNEENDLSEIYKTYDAIVSVSNIIYNEGQTKAIVLMSFSRGKLSGFLAQYYVELKDNQWRVVASKMLLVS